MKAMWLSERPLKLNSFTSQRQQGGRKGSIICLYSKWTTYTVVLLIVAIMWTAALHPLVRHLMCSNVSFHYPSALANPLQARNAKCINRKRSESKKKESLYLCPNPLQHWPRWLESSSDWVGVITGPDFPASRSTVPGKLFFWEGSHLIMHAGDACQAGLFPQLIFFHNLPCRLNLIILAHGQTATAFRWCIQYQRPWSQGWSIRWKGRVLAKDSAPWSNEASPTLWAWAEQVTLEMHEGQ